MRYFLTIFAVMAGLFVSMPVFAGKAAGDAIIYKNPACGCCESYAEYLRENGFTVTVKPTEKLLAMKSKLGVPSQLEGCHTMLIGGYVVEGHVPVNSLRKLLRERPKIKGISLPGMPMGSPGMGASKTAPFKIYELKDGPSRVYTVE